MSSLHLNASPKQKAKNPIPNVHPTNSLILEDGKIFKIQKKRQRKILSCIPCHQRKIKCSREVPVCNNCQKLAQKNVMKEEEILSACKYFDNDKKKNLKKKGFVNIDNLHGAISLKQEDSTNLNSMATSIPDSARNGVSNANNSLGIKEMAPSDVGSENDNGNENEDGKDFENGYFQSNNNQKVNIQGNERLEESVFQNISHDPYEFEDVKSYNLVNESASVENEYSSQPPEGERYEVPMINKEMYSESQQSYQQPQDHILQGPPLSRNSSEAKRQILIDTQIKTQEVRNIDRQPSQPEAQSRSHSQSQTQSRSQSQSQSQSQSESPGSIYPNYDADYYSKQFVSQFEYILVNMPTKERSDELLQHFQVSIHSLLPILDMDSFLRKYNDFWYCGLFLSDNIEKLFQFLLYYKDKNIEIPEKINDFLYWYNKSSCILNTSNLMEFLTLLYAVYYSSITSLVYQHLPTSNNNNILNYKPEVNKYYKVFKKMNHRGLNNPKIMSLAVLQINVLVQSICNLKSGKSLINVAKILRICQFYQLNRDPVIFHGLKDKDLVQTRRIVWWQIFLLDNLISFFLNLSPLIKLSDFDTSLLMENLEQTNSEPNYGIMYLNTMFRFILIVDDLNGLVNGLNIQLKTEDINNLKHKINDLYIVCNSTRARMQMKFQTEKFHDQIDCFKFCILSLNILSDKILIMLQKKILLNPYFSLLTPNSNNLNLKLKSSTYNYTDLSGNLLPSLLHYLHMFTELSKPNLMKYNWKLKNYIPIDELILLMQILATNFKNGSTQNNPLEPDINMKIHLIEETINVLKHNWHRKLSSVNKLISLVSNLWELMSLKYHLDLNNINNLSKKIIYPTPTHDPTPTPEQIQTQSPQQLHRGQLQQQQQQSQSQQNQTELVLQRDQKSDQFYQQESIMVNYSVSCAEIAPRAIRAAAAPSEPSNYSSHDNLTHHSGSSPRENNSHYLCNINDSGYVENGDSGRQVKLTKLIEEELAKEGGDSMGSEEDEGWLNLGTEEGLGADSIDDFHFYKNLKNDVIRLFKLVVT